MKELIEFTDFLEIEKKLEIRIGKIIMVDDVPKSDKLLKLTVDFGNNEIRTVVTNIKPHLGGDHGFINGMAFPFVTNLKPVKMMGIKSTAMILPGDVEGKNMILGVNARLGVQIL